MSPYPSRHSTRLRDYDYAQAGAYFTTLCTEQRICLLGRIVEGDMRLSPAGQMVATVWRNLGEYYPGVAVDAHVVMPNHLHGIIVLSGVTKQDEDRADRDRDRATVPTPVLSLSTVMQRFKSFTTYEYGKGVRSDGWPRYPGRLWQHRFHERVIRNERELDAIREYIVNNPLQWHLDRENPERGDSR